MVVIAAVMAVALYIQKLLVPVTLGLLFTTVYASRLLQEYVPVRFVITTLVFVLLVGLLLNYPRVKGGLFWGLCLGTSAGTMIYVLIGGALEASQQDALFRYVVLYPAAVLAGVALQRSGQSSSARKAYAWTSLLFAAAAIAERLLGTFFVAGTYMNANKLMRDSEIRSIVFSDHPLVLSVLFLVAAPTIWYSGWKSSARVCCLLILAGGVWSTSSRGAIVLSLFWLAMLLATRIGWLSRRSAREAGLLLVTGVSCLVLYAAILGGDSELTSSDNVAASAEYRTSLYAASFESLRLQPFGWGIQGLPEGVFIVNTRSGSLDIANTVDSEFVLASFDFGLLGIMLFMIILVLPLSKQRLLTWEGQAALLATLSGFYLALHAWTGIGFLWLLCFGLAAAAAPGLSRDSKGKLEKSPYRVRLQQ